MDTHSLNGNGQARSFGFTVNVRVSHIIFAFLIGLGSTAGSGKTILSYALLHFLPFQMTDVFE